MFALSTTIFGSVGLMYGLMLPLGVALLFAILLLPAVLSGTASPKQATKAVYCYILEGVGIVLITAGGLPALYGVLAQITLERDTYLALLIVFTMGGAIFLWHDHIAQAIDSSARALPEAIFYYTFKFIGLIATILALIVLALQVLLQTPPFAPEWWIMPTIVLLYGLLLMWCTLERTPRVKPFNRSPMIAPPIPPRQPPSKPLKTAPIILKPIPSKKKGK